MQIPGLVISFDVPTGGFVQISTDGGVSCTSASSTTSVDVVLIVDGGFIKKRRLLLVPPPVPGASEATWSLSTVLALSPGTHRVQVAAGLMVSPGAIVDVSGGLGDAHQGEVDVVVINQ